MRYGNFSATGLTICNLHRCCRFYEAKYPEMDDVVMVQVKSIAEMGAYVSLLEYGGIEGMILLSELSRRRIRSVQKLIKVGRQEPVMVLRVDKEKGYIDLSKRRVSPEDLAVSMWRGRGFAVCGRGPQGGDVRVGCGVCGVSVWAGAGRDGGTRHAKPPSLTHPPQKCEERFAKSKMVHSIMRNVAETCGVEVEELYQQVGWPLYRLYGHAYDAFQRTISEGDAIFTRLSTEAHGGAAVPVLTPEVKEALLKNVRRRMTPQPIKIRADVEMTCFAYDGVEHIKTAMRAAGAASAKDCEVSIKLVAPPLYVLTTQTLDRGAGIDILTAAVAACKASIEGAKGSLRVKEAARAVSEREERALQEELEAAEAANREVGGDSGSEEEYEEGMSVDVDAAPALAI